MADKKVKKDKEEKISDKFVYGPKDRLILRDPEGNIIPLDYGDDEDEDEDESPPEKKEEAKPKPKKEASRREIIKQDLIPLLRKHKD